MRVARTGSLVGLPVHPFLLCLLYCLFFSSASVRGEGSLSSPREEARARPLLSLAQESAAADDWFKASILLAQARQSGDNDGDILYLSAIACLKSNDDAASALGFLSIALSSGGFSAYSEREALDLYAALLIRLKRYDEALAALTIRSSGTRGSPELDPEYRRLRALAFLGKGLKVEAAVELLSAVNRFPEDPRFARIFFERYREAPSTAAIRSLGELLVRRLPSLISKDSALAILAAPFMLNAAAREDSLRAFRASGARSTWSTLRCLEYGLLDEVMAVGEFFAISPKIDVEELRFLGNQLRSDEGKKALTRALASFSGHLENDRDGDGFAEELAEYDSGSLVSWSLDEDQDGWRETEVALKGGIPQHCRVQSDTICVDVEYGDYPYIAGLSFRDCVESPDILDVSSEFNRRIIEGIHYQFAPESLAYAPVLLQAYPSSLEKTIFLPRPSHEDLPSARAAAADCLEMDYSQDGMLWVFSIDKARVVRRERYSSGKPYSILEYSQGWPDEERVDSDGDGYFETLRKYRPKSDGGDSSVSSVLLDIDRDGIFEYSEENYFPFRKEWDLDKNGSMDLAQYSLEDSSTRLEISSKFNGHFDETLVIDPSGKISSLSKNGLNLSLIADSNPSLRWIENKVFDLANNMPAEEGIYSFMGRRYRLIFFGRDAFAELLP